jgi:hypothetical protein
VTFFSDNTISKFFDSSEILRDYSSTPQITTIITQAVKPFHPKTRVAIFDSSDSPKVLEWFFGEKKPPSLKIIEKT